MCAKSDPGLTRVEMGGIGGLTDTTSESCMTAMVSENGGVEGPKLELGQLRLDTL